MCFFLIYKYCVADFIHKYLLSENRDADGAVNETDKVLAHSVGKRQTNAMKEETIISNSNCGNVFEGNKQDSHIYSRGYSVWDSSQRLL